MMISKIVIVFSAVCIFGLMVQCVDLVSMTETAPTSTKSTTVQAKPTTTTAGVVNKKIASKSATTRSPISDEALDKALTDKRYLQRQLKCALGEAPCDPVGKRLKSLAPFVLRGACPQCTPGETRQIQKTLAHIQRNYPQQWNKLIQAYTG